MDIPAPIIVELDTISSLKIKVLWLIFGSHLKDMHIMKAYLSAQNT